MTLRVSAILVFLCTVGCGTERQYDRLCKIYEEAAGQPTTPELQVQLATRVEQEAPSVYQPYYVVAVINTPIEERYEKMQRYARGSLGHEWTCEAMKQRYPPGVVH